MAQIDTPFRPHRVLALFIGALIFIIVPVRNLKYSANDLKLIGVYLFGLVPSFIAYLENRLEFDYFLLTSLQLFIILWIFFQIKALPLEIGVLHKLFHVFCFFAMVNSGFMIYTFLFEDIGRQSGFMDNPNYAAFTLNVALVYFAYQLSKVDDARSGWYRFFCFVAFIIVLVGIFVTGSRSAMISLVFSVFLYLYFHFSWKKIIIGFLLFIVVSGLLMQLDRFQNYMDVVPLLNRLESLSGREESRITLWKQGWMAFADTYYLGLGIEQFKNPDIYIQYLQTSDNPMLVAQEGLVLHNDYLAVLFEYGIIPFLLFVSFYFTILRNLLKQSNIRYRSMWLIIFMNIVLFSFFDTTFQSMPFWFIVMIVSAFSENPVSRVKLAEGEFVHQY
ncbi:MAG: O-antigen ligase family protein [Saprospiraceae bacterium]|nr:O-antigen ligase family protein [Saprospiraceae bacterium]